MAIDPKGEGNVPAGRTGQYLGHGLPYRPLGDYPGKIIAIEGTDGVGRSTQIRMLREWLEVQGYGVVETGWTRSTLMQPTIDLAKASNTLNKLTFVLLYATDFADRLEKEVIPALEAGFVVLADRYIFTAIARAQVRGVDRAWLRGRRHTMPGPDPSSVACRSTWLWVPEGHPGFAPGGHRDSQSCRPSLAASVARQEPVLRVPPRRPISIPLR